MNGMKMPPIFYTENQHTILAAYKKEVKELPQIKVGDAAGGIGKCTPLEQSI